MCCGAKSKTTQARFISQSMRIPSPAAPLPDYNATKPSSVQFEYVGKTRMTVISPNTGIRYHFEAPGTQVTVDPRDQVMMLHVPDLRPVRFTRQ
jgi:hypothetical protein